MRAAKKTPNSNSTYQLLLNIAPFIVIGIYVIVACIKIKYPGVMYDEALYLNAALGGVDKVTFVTKTFHGFPILLMPYIGALKSYIFFPIFGIFKASVYSMRIPDIIFTAGGLYMLYAFLKEYLGRYLSLCILALTAFSASFIVFTRIDNGPVVLDFIIKIAGLLFLFKFYKNSSLRYLVLFWVFMLLGVFNKLNFIWYVNAFSASFVLIYGKALWNKLPRRDLYKIIAISAVGYALSLIYYLYINSTYNLGSSLGFVGWTTIKSLLIPMITGSWFYNYALSATKLGSSVFFWFIAVISIIGLLAYLKKVLLRGKHTISKADQFYGFIYLVLAMVLIQLAITKQATAGWHYFSIFPFFEIVFVLSLAYILRALVLPRYTKRILISVGLVVAVLSTYQLDIYDHYIVAFNKPPSNIIWSPAIYSLSNYAKAQRNSQFVSLDWGTQTQLIGFNPIHNKYYEVFGPVSVSNYSAYTSYVLDLSNPYYVSYVSSSSGAPNSTQQFFNLVGAHDKKPYLVKVIYYENQPIFDIYKLKSEP